MKKRLLFAALALVSAMGSFAYEVNEYVYTPNQRLKITSENKVTNGNFADGTTGWTDATGAGINADVWDYRAGEGPNGENVLTSLGATADAALCNSWPVSAGVTYVVAYDVKGLSNGTTVIKPGENNYADFYTDINGTLTKSCTVDNKGNITLDPGVAAVASVNGFLNDWKTVFFLFTPEVDTYLCMHFEKLVTDVSVTNFGLYEATEVYDDRDLQRKVNYADMILGMEGVDPNADGGNFTGILGVIKGFLTPEGIIALDDKASIEGMLADYDAMLLNFLNLNSSDLLKDEKRWSAYGDTRKFDNIGNWKGSGGRWFHKNNGGGDGDEIGHRLQGGMAAGAASMHYTITPSAPGNYMFSVETQGYYMAGSSSASGLQYVPDWNEPFNGTTFWGGPEELWTDAAVIEASQNIKVKADTLNHQYYETIVINYNVTQEMVDAKTPLSFGVSYVPDPNHTAKMGSNLQLRNPQIRLMGVDQATADYKAEVAAIKAQQTELASRIVTATEKNAQTKAEGFPWGHEDMANAIVAAQEVLDASYAFVDADGNVVSEDAIKAKLQEGETKESDEILAQVNAIKRAWQDYESLNGSFTGLQAQVAEADSVLAAHPTSTGDRRTALESLVSEAKGMIEATGADSEKEAFDAKKNEIALAETDFLNNLASYLEPIAQVIAANPEAYNAAGWTYTDGYAGTGDAGKGNFKKATQGNGWKAGYYTAFWRGNSAYPPVQMAQTVTVKDAGIYQFTASVNALNENASRHWPTCEIIMEDPEAGTVADTLFTNSEAKLFFGTNGAPDSVRVISRTRLDGGNQNSGAGSALGLGGYDAHKYSIFFVKEGNDPVEVEFGFGTLTASNNPNGGFNTAGFGDTELNFMGNFDNFKTAIAADMTTRIAKAQTTLDNAIADAEGTAVAQATWVSRLQRRLPDANKALAAVSDVKSYTNLINAVYAVEEIAAKIDAYVTGIKGVSVKEEVAPVVMKGVYTLSGLKVADSIENVKSGLYIYNGKKYVVK